LYVPASVSSATSAPLVVMLHGCDESPADFELGAAMNALADAHGFLVAYPAEPSSANVLRCWNWFLAADQARGAGEPAWIASVVPDVASDHKVDPKAVFVAGISSGAAMAVILGATYPDVFAAIGVHSGLEYAAATDATSAFNAQSSGGPAPKTQGDAAFAAMGSVARAVPALVIHGDADTTVNVTNASQVIAQWAETDTRAGDTISTTATTSVDGTAGGRTFTHTTYADTKSGATMLELYLVHGLNHAWSGGTAGAPYTDSQGPSASTLLWTFFDAHRKS
ncbi:MAG: alpha/beta hydrolase family esterase, partial [Polyangiales bacterium]